jgi:hypothetical protein
MIRTQVQLPEAEYEQLRDIAARERRSMADCIREGVQLFLDRFRQAGGDLDSFAGKFRPLPVDDLKPHDRWYTATAQDARSPEDRP